MSYEEALNGVRALYEWNCVGCCLHIVLDDGNLEDHHVQLCVDFALKQNHPECIALAKLIFELSEEDRERLYQQYPYDAGHDDRLDAIRWQVASQEEIKAANPPELLEQGRFCIPMVGWMWRKLPD